MKCSRAAILLFVLLTGMVTVAQGARPEYELMGGDTRIHGGPAGVLKAAVDTTEVMGPWGSGAAFNGQFETPEGWAQWNGWTSQDLTQAEINHWHAADYNVVNGNYSAWCGTLAYPACHGADVDGGYGNNWNDVLEWRGDVADPAASCLVTIDAVLNHDTEPGYDFAYVECLTADGTAHQLIVYDDWAAEVVLHETFVYAPGDYVDGQVVVRFRVDSDGAVSDEDCLYFQGGAGAVQLDDVVITLDNGTGTSHDFEDGTLGPFQPVIPQGVGDFASVRDRLGDVDPCRTNTSPQMTFIDDGLVVPGTGGTTCINHCYGPGGYILNHSGGLMGPEAHLENEVRSPVMPWPAGLDGGLLCYTVYEDDDAFTLGNDDPGIFHRWRIRSTSSADPADIANAPWTNDNFFYFNEFHDGRYRRMVFPVGEYLVPGATYVQVALGASELGFIWNQSGADGTPAPYFDDVRLQAFPAGGPEMFLRADNLVPDAFPQNGTVDMTDPGDLSARFDAAHFLDGPSDSVTVEINLLREGAALSGTPQLHYRLRTNPVFDSHRTSGLPAVGAVDGWQAYTNGFGHYRFAFDLPDTGFLFPGDELRYYLTASDDVGGDARTTILPADTTGFAGGNYDPYFTVRILPDIREVSGMPDTFTWPSVVVWSDRSDWLRSIEVDHEAWLWESTLAQLGLERGVDYDLCTRRSRNSRLSFRVSVEQLGHYDDILYTSGLAHSDALQDEDVAVLESWFALGGRDLLLMGFDIASFLDVHSVATRAFATDRLGMGVIGEELPRLIDGQRSPRVVVSDGNPVFTGAVTAWKSESACAGSGDRFANHDVPDAVEPAVGAQVLAEYTTRAGATGAYPYAAGLLNTVAADNGRTIFLPVTLHSVRWAEPAAKAAASISARARVLADVLAYFSVPLDPANASSVPAASAFVVSNYPNPFNPSTRFDFNLPRSGHLELRIFDVRGRLVRGLLDERRPAGPGHVEWDGRNDAGQSVSSGVYFYEARTGAEVRTAKIALIK